MATPEEEAAAVAAAEAATAKAAAAAKSGEWKSGLDANIRDHACMSNMNTPSDIAKSWVNAQGLIGADKIPVPATADDPLWQTTYDRLGRPKDAGGYVIADPQGLPEGFKVTDEVKTAFRESAHKRGLSQAQAEGVFADIVSQQGGVFKDLTGKNEVAADARRNALKAEWGPAYAAQMELAEKTLAHYGGDKAPELAAKFKDDPSFSRMLAKMGADISEDVLGQGGPKPSEMTPDAAQKVINETMSAGDKHPYFDPNHAEHKWWVETRMPQLQTVVHGDGMLDL